MRTSKLTKLVMSACVIGGAAALTACTADAGVPLPPAAASVEERSAATKVLPSPPSRDDRIAYEEFTRELSALVGDEGPTIEQIDGEKNGFAGFSVSRDLLEVNLYWVGEVAPSVIELMDDHPETTVAVHEAEYSLPDMIAARDAVSGGYEHVSGDNGELFTVGPDYRGHGLQLRVRASESEVSRDQVVRAVAQLTDMPVVSVIIGEDQFASIGAVVEGQYRPPAIEDGNRR